MAYDFNGTNQSLQTASAPATGLPMTLACWFRSTSVTASQTLMAVNNSSSSFRGMRLIAEGAQAGDPLRADISDDSGVAGIARSTAGYSANTWHHACGVFLSATSRTSYLDGGNSATNTTNVAAAITVNALSIAGRFNSGSMGLLLGGTVAEVGVWSTNLSADEVLSLSRGMTCDKVRPQSLVFYAPLVRDLIDVKGGLTITNNNTATVANHPRVYA